MDFNELTIINKISDMVILEIIIFIKKEKFNVEDKCQLLDKCQFVTHQFFSLLQISFPNKNSSYFYVTINKLFLVYGIIEKSL